MSIATSEERALLRASVAKLAGGFGHAYFQDCVRRGVKADELWTAVGEAGFIGVNLPEAYGGGGGGVHELAIVCEELAAAGCPLLLLVTSPAICGEVLARSGTAAQRRRWLPGIANGALRMAFAITEPEAGSNAHRLATTATPHGDGWRLNGQKYYISGMDEADAVLVVARTGDHPDTGAGRLSLFLVDTDAAGLRREVIPVEIRAPEKQFTVWFDDVDVGADRLIGTAGDGLRHVFAGLNPERITGAAQATGIGRYALERAARYARERSVWGAPIGTHQGVAHPLAAAKINLELARLATWHAADLHDAGDRTAPEAANMAKYAAAEASLECLDAAIQAHGGNGLATEYGLADMWGAARLARTAPVSREMILNYVAQHSLGLPRSY